jgi:hypothetical protein
MCQYIGVFFSTVMIFNWELLTLSGTASAYVLLWAGIRIAAGRARRAARATRREFMMGC